MNSFNYLSDKLWTWAPFHVCKFSFGSISVQTVCPTAQKVSPIQPPRHESNKEDDSNGQAIHDRGKPTRPQPHTKDWRQLSKPESRRDGPHQGAHQLVGQCQMVSPEKHNAYKWHYMNSAGSSHIYLRIFMCRKYIYSHEKRPQIWRRVER